MNAPRVFPMFAIFVVALGLRLFSLSGMEAYPRFELIRNTLDDQVAFDSWAKAIAAGEKFDYSETAHEFAYWAAARPGVYPQTPAYPFFVAAIYKTFGPRYDFVRVAQMLLGALTAVLIYALASRFVGRGIAFLCGLAAAGYGPLVFYEGTFLRAGPTVFATAAGLLATDYVAERANPARSESSATDRHKDSLRFDNMVALGCGIILGFSVLLRPTNLAFAGAAMGWIMLRRYPTGFSACARTVGAVAMGVGLTLAPVIATNTIASGSPAFLSSNGPYIFFISNVHDATGLGAGQSPYYYEVKNSAPREEINLVAETIADIRRHPKKYVQRQLKKLAVYFSGREVPNNLNYEMGKRLNPRQGWAFVEFWMLLPIATLGFLVSLTQARRYGLLYLFFALQALTTVAFYVIGRLRLPLTIVLLIFAGVGVEALLKRGRPMKQQGVVALALLVVLLATISGRPNHPLLRPTDFEMAAAALMTRAQDLETAGATDQAQHAYARVVALNPNHAQALIRYNLLDRTTSAEKQPSTSRKQSDLLCEQARSLIRDGTHDAARRLLREAAELAPDSARPYRYLANLSALIGDLTDAERALELALNINPNDEQSRQNLIGVRARLAAQRTTF